MKCKFVVCVVNGGRGGGGGGGGGQASLRGAEENFKYIHTG